MKQVVIMPGGFHPFHAGHLSLYNAAKEQFPQADVYVAATNDTSERPFPFAIKEKLAKLSGVANGQFVQVKNPFRAEEITSKYNPDEDVLIFVRSEKDRNEQPKPGGVKKNGTPSYFQPYTGKNLQPFSKHAYLYYLPTVEFGPGITSATEIRNAWPKLNDKRKQAMIMSLYPATVDNKKLLDVAVKLLDAGMGVEQINMSETKKNSKNDIDKSDYDKEDYIDPDLYNSINFAKQHYPTAKNAEQAFMKLMQRGLMHSREDLENHDQEIENLTGKVTKLEGMLVKVIQQLIKEKSETLESKNFSEKN